MLLENLFLPCELERQAGEIVRFAAGVADMVARHRYSPKAGLFEQGDRPAVIGCHARGELRRAVSDILNEAALSSSTLPNPLGRQLVPSTHDEYSEHRILR